MNNKPNKGKPNSDCLVWYELMALCCPPCKNKNCLLKNIAPRAMTKYRQTIKADEELDKILNDSGYRVIED